LWLLGELLTNIGLPVFVISASAPLLQKWFSSTLHPSGRDPYFLYAASNAGSLIALVAFPLLLEPNFRLPKQGLFWAGAYGVLVVLIIGCVASMWRLGLLKTETRPKADQSGQDAEPKETLRTLTRLRWMTLAFIPSSLVLGVTTYITTDIASTPLLWVVPLSLYLLSYVMAFAKRQILPQRIVIYIVRAAAVVITLIFLSGILEPIWLLLQAHLLFFFFAALVCHNQLAAERPSPFYLTEFYLWVATGGVLGGVFNALLAPLLFSTVFEYPLVIVLACAMLPRVGAAAANGQKASGWYWQGDLLNPVGIGLLTAGLITLVTRSGVGTTEGIAVGLGVPLTINYVSATRPLRFALGIAAIMAVSFFIVPTGDTLYSERNFYGTLRVVDDRSAPSHMLYDGRTLHGWQFTEEEHKCEPLSYYHRTGPLGSLFAAFNVHPATPNVAVIGLGAGGMIPYARTGQKWTYFEINPAVVRVAKDGRLFTYLQDCAAAAVEINLGDARLQIRNAPDASYGLIVLDAFSSDAIPVHLLTSEAIELYLSKLADQGLLAIHITNRSLNLTPVVGDLAADTKLASVVFTDRNYEVSKGKAASQWVVLARQPSDLSKLLKDRRWRPLRARAHPRVWTDDFSDIISALNW
jgi:spermidine synthase